MNSKLRSLFEAELKEALSAERRDQIDEAWRHLARAHIISQPFAGPHVKVHWRMFLLGVRQHNWREIFGQLFRLALAAPGSLLGKAPLGNTGLSNVSAFQPMPIPEDLKQLIEEAKNSSKLIN